MTLSDLERQDVSALGGGACFTNNIPRGRGLCTPNSENT